MSNFPETRHAAIFVRPLVAGLVLALITLGFAGCRGDRLPTAPAQGKVTYKGKPLEFGSVLFQPNVGPPARGKINSDGTFVLSTYGNGDGAVIGKHQVRISCFGLQSPAAKRPSRTEELPTTDPLIPAKYTNLDQSGIAVEVKEQNEPFVFNLKD